MMVIMMTVVTAALKLKVKANENTNHFNRLINIFPVLGPGFRLGGSLWFRRLFLFNLFRTFFYKQSIKASIIIQSYLTSYFFMTLKLSAKKYRFT